MKTNMTRREAGALVGATLTSALVPSVARAQGKQIVIGGRFPLSGANAQIGVDAKHAHGTALEITNNKRALDLPLARPEGLPNLGGAKLAMPFADHQSDPQKGRAEA